MPEVVPNLDEIERLLTQSMNGLHVLFDNAMVAKILQKPTEELDFFSFDNLDRIQSLFTKFVERPTLNDKKDFIASLDRESYEILVRTYFHIVDNSILAANRPRH
ncbi:MAG: hypothetical protein AB7N80_14685 [Bdellovibrionales bacterium]